MRGTLLTLLDWVRRRGEGVVVRCGIGRDRTESNRRMWRMIKRNKEKGDSLQTLRCHAWSPCARQPPQLLFSLPPKKMTAHTKIQTAVVQTTVESQPPTTTAVAAGLLRPSARTTKAAGATLFP